MNRELRTAKLLLLLCLMTSCVTRRACERKFPVTETESTSEVVRTITVYRDTTIYITLPGDMVCQEVPVNQISRLNTTLASSEAWIENGSLKHTLVQKDTTIAKTLKGALVNQSKEVRCNVLVEKETAFQIKKWMWIAGVGILLIVHLIPAFSSRRS